WSTGRRMTSMDDITCLKLRYSLASVRLTGLGLWLCGLLYATIGALVLIAGITYFLDWYVVDLRSGMSLCSNDPPLWMFSSQSPPGTGYGHFGVLVPVVLVLMLGVAAAGLCSPRYLRGAAA